jgi:carbamoyl-phosphate synthase large subunit
MKKQLTVAVSGINAVDNPGPGVAVARSLKESKEFDIRVIGLAYDNMDPGIYMDWVVDKSYMMPYPSGDQNAFLDRLFYIHAQEKIDFVIPNLDAELPVYIKYRDQIERQGIKTFLPDQQQFRLRGKDKLDEVGRKIGIEVPPGKTVTSYDELNKAVDDLGLPVMVKGAFYKAYKAGSKAEAVSLYNKLVAEWGYPIIVQKVVTGEEMNVVGVGDGNGGSLGLVGIKKMWITSLGKIWTGVTVEHEGMLAASQAFMREFKWRGGFELECMVDGDTIYLIEINPRLPAWCYFATGVGINLPENMLKTVMGLPCEVPDSYEAGKLFVRYTYEMITDMKVFTNIVTKGES